MKQITIYWDSFKDGIFPIEEIENIGLIVKMNKLSLLKYEIEISIPEGEIDHFTPDFIFKLGMVVQACVSK